jgi:hypothetical protein
VPPERVSISVLRERAAAAPVAWAAALEDADEAADAKKDFVSFAYPRTVNIVKTYQQIQTQRKPRCSRARSHCAMIQ